MTCISAQGAETRLYHRGQKACRDTARLRALFLAASAIGGFYGGQAAEAGPIHLNNDTLAGYIQQEEGIAWLKGGQTPAAEEQNYLIDERTDAVSLSLRAADASLTVDTGKQADTVPILSAYDVLRVDEGSLHILAAKALKPYDPPIDDFGRPVVTTPAAVGFYALSAADPGFTQTGGAVGIEARDDAIAMQGSNFYSLEGGSFAVRTQDQAVGLDLCYTDMVSGEHRGADALFRQQGGQTAFSAAGGSIGLRSNQSLAVSGGRLQIHAADEARAIMLYDNDTEFRLKDGAVAIKAAGAATGLETAKLQMDGGALYLESGGSSKAIHLISGAHEDGTEQKGAFLLRGGALQIARNAASPGGYAAYGEDGSFAFFGKDSILQPVLDSAAAGGGAAPITGFMSFGSVEIEPGAALNVRFSNTDKITAAAPVTLGFLESREAAVKGAFADSGQSGETLFYSYQAVKSADGKTYQIRLTPKDKNSGKPDGGDKGENSHKPALQISDTVHGNNRAAALAMEAALKTPQEQAGAAYPLLRQLHDALYNSKLGEEGQLNRRLRRLSPNQATRLPALTLSAQQRFTEDMRNKAAQFFIPERAGAFSLAEQAAERQNLWTAWLTPTGGHARYRAQNSSFETLTADYGGLNFGAAAHNETLAADAAAGFDIGQAYGDGGYHADMRHMFIGGGFACHWAIGALLKPILDMHLSYGSGRFTQRRRDSFAAANHAHINQNSFMLSSAVTQYYALEAYNLQFAPQLGLDYAYIRQNAYTESGGLLPLRASGRDFHALRPKLGSAVLWAAGKRLGAKAYGFYRYDALDTNINLDTRLRDMAAMAWTMRGEQTKRSSAEVGLQMEYRPQQNIMVSGAYDLSLREKRAAQQFSAQTKVKF